MVGKRAGTSGGLIDATTINPGVELPLPKEPAVRAWPLHRRRPFAGDKHAAERVLVHPRALGRFAQLNEAAAILGHWKLGSLSLPPVASAIERSIS